MTLKGKWPEAVRSDDDTGVDQHCRTTWAEPKLSSPGIYRVRITKTWGDYETGQRCIGVLLNPRDVAKAKLAGTTGFTAETYKDNLKLYRETFLARKPPLTCLRCISLARTSRRMQNESSLYLDRRKDNNTMETITVHVTRSDGKYNSRTSHDDTDTLSGSSPHEALGYAIRQLLLAGAFDKPVKLPGYSNPPRT